MSRNLLRQALKAIYASHEYTVFDKDFPKEFKPVVEAIEAELAKPEQEPKLSDAGADTNITRGLEPKGSGMVTLHQPEQEPVAWMDENGLITRALYNLDESWTPLYTAPPRKEWVSLSDTEINKIVDLNTSDDGGFDIWCDGLAVAHIVCAKLKELNK